jgi:hemerythrin-like metal-binding protein
MLYINWTDNNMLNIPIIDEQHRVIVAIINSLYYFNQKGRGDEIFTSTLKILGEYTNLHFKTEEDLLQETDYPDFDRHIELHRILAGRTHTYTADYVDIIGTLSFLKIWWLNHINVEDRKYVEHVLKMVD